MSHLDDIIGNVTFLPVCADRSFSIACRACRLVSVGICQVIIGGNITLHVRNIPVISPDITLISQ
jgi:hypothetical protein